MATILGEPSDHAHVYIYGKILGQENEEWLVGFNKSTIKVCGLVINLIDRLMHNSLQGHQESMRSWRYVKERLITENVDCLIGGRI